MIKIVALNDEDEDKTNEEEELVATQEAQETIAESEYIRAIKLKTEGEIDLCLHLLRELLETQVLNDNTSTKNNRNNKLWNIKYNCHKIIAFILEERGEFMLAIQHYISAILIDSTDVSTMHKFGQLALKINATDLAEYAFENCLGRNAAHWCAAEGMLQVMYRNRNIIGSYTYAGKIIQQDVNCENASQTLKQITNLFQQNLPFLENCGGGSIADMNSFANKQFTPPQSFWNLSDVVQSSEDISNNKPDLKEFYIKQINWRSIGEFIVQVYSYLQEMKHDMLFTYNFNDIIINSNTIDGETAVISDIKEIEVSDVINTQDSGDQDNEAMKNCETVTDQSKNSTGENCDAPQSMDYNNYDDSDSNAKSDGGEINKTKPKRRCSDLHFLEQWGWHKNRRYSSRKKTERDEIDTSLNGYLRKIFEKYTNIPIEYKWPFSNDLQEKNIHMDSEECKECKIKFSEDLFNSKTIKELEKLTEKLKEKSDDIDLMDLTYKWLKYISSSWLLPLPDNLATLYIEIFEIYITHFSFSSWTLLNSENFEACYRICLLFLELSASKNQLNDDKDSLWNAVFHHLLFNLSNLNMISTNSDTVQDIYQLKLIILEYLKLNNRNRIKDCVSCLQQISEILEQKNSFFTLHLPNISNMCCINLTYIKNLKLKYKRQIDTNSIPYLYEQGCWDKLQTIIMANIESSGEIKYDNKCWLEDICTQLEILLQSFWMMGSYENCLIWSEKCFHFAVSHYLLQEPKTSSCCSLLAHLINFITSYIEGIILNEGFHIVMVLSKENLSRLIQDIIRILVYQFDGTFEKNSNHGHELNFKRTWIILHQLLLREENDSPSSLNTKSGDDDMQDVNELIPKSFLILFTAHDYLGKRQWCTNDNGEFLQYVLDAVVVNLKAPVYDVCRDFIYEYIEQVTYCLFKYPQKKARQRHLEDHEASQVKICWPKAVQIFDLYRPEDLPEFNSYKLESITSDMEQLLIKMLNLMPKDLDPSMSIHDVTKFIEGQIETPPAEANAFKLPYKILCLYYLLADFYFKNRDFLKAIKYYTLDLAVNPTRYDSWAGMALSKASIIETKLNGLDPISMDTLWMEYEEVLRCFECCINLNRFQTLLWIEYGSFSYTIHSCFSRYLKSNKEKLSTELLSVINERKDKMLSIAFNCFSLANSLQNAPPATTVVANSEDATNDDANDEKWLCQYMLGKIAERRKEEPKVYLNHYLMAANYLYENSATYPIKINHSNPTTLSVEALEVFYRINAAIIKYLQNEKEITRSIGDLFNKILKNLSNSPFAYNKAKIDGNSLNILKGKIVKPSVTPNSSYANAKQETGPGEASNNVISLKTLEETTPAVIITSSGTSSVMSSDSSTVESDSDSDEDSLTDNVNGAFNAEKLKLVYRLVVQNIEECATRFPEHYKSIYRLIYHNMFAPEEFRDLTKCEQLLIGQYKTSLGNLVNGLFYDRKNNNLFNGIWRIPSSEIDRPGSFSAHLVKCVKIFIQLLYKTNNHGILVDISINLSKTPDTDKRYITDAEREDLHQQCINYCIQILRDILQRNLDNRNDTETLNLLIDIYKIYKKCLKYMNKKEAMFRELLVEVYKFFIKNKVEYVPDNSNFFELAIKLCVQEITAQKNMEKSLYADTNTNTSDFIVTQASVLPQFPNASSTRFINIPGLNTRPKYRTNAMKSSSASSTTTSTVPIQNPLNHTIADFTKSPQFLSMFGVFGGGNQVATRDTPEFQKLFEEFYSKLMQPPEQHNVEAVIPSKTINSVENHTTTQPPLIPNSQASYTSNPNLRETSVYVHSSNVDENLLTLSTDTFLQNQLSSSMPKQQYKTKSSNKNKSNVFKPYTRPIQTESSQNTVHNAAPSNYKIDMFSNHANVLAAYSNLLQNTTYAAPTQKKSKVNLPETSTSNYISNLSMIAKDCHNDLTSIKPTTTFNIPSSNFLTAMQSRNQFQPQQNSTNIISPTKTLQEKLAERQKANKLNETNSKSAFASEKVVSSCDDVIVLD